MTIAIVGTTSGKNTAQASLTLTYSATPGNCLVLCVQSVNGLSATISGGGTWVLADGANLGGGECAIWYVANCSSSSTVTITTASGSSQQLTAQLYEFSGVSQVSPLDVTKHNGVTTPRVSSWTSFATAFTAEASEVWVGMMGGLTGGAAFTTTGAAHPWTNAFIPNVLGGINSGMVSGYQVASAQGNPVYSGSTGANTISFSAVVIALKSVATTVPGTVSMTASGTLTPHDVLAGTVSMSASGTFAPEAAGYGNATMAGTGTFSATGVLVGTLSMSGSGTMVPSQSVALVEATWTGSFSVPVVITGVPPQATQSLPVTVSNTDGNWMFAVLSWHQADGYPPASFSVADDAHNQWEPLGAPSGTSSGDATMRTAIWYSAAARASTLVMCAPTGFVLSACALIIEVSGMEPGVAQVAPVTTAEEAATALATLTTGAPAGGAFFLAAAAGDLNSSAVTVAEAAWTGLPQVTATNGYDDTTDITMVSAWQNASSAVGATWSCPVAQDLAGIAGGVISSTPLPGQLSPAWPVTILEVAPGAGFATSPDELSWVQVADPPRFLNFAITQGKQYELDQVQAAQGTLQLDNPDGALIPPGTGEFAGIDSGTPVRLRMIWAGGGPYPGNATPYFVPFSGFFERWPQAWDVNTQRGITETTLVDGWAYCQAVLNSILRIEILADGPYAYWPLGDPQGAVYASNAAPGNTSTLVLVPSRYGISTATSAFGADGSAIPGDSTATAVSAGGIGTTGGTVWQQAGLPGAYSLFGYTLYCEDSAYPRLSNGVTIEGWFQLTDTTTYQNSVLWVIKGSKGPIMQAYVDTSGFLWLATWDVNGNQVATLIDGSQSYLAPAAFFHLAVTWDGGIDGWDAYVNGTLLASSASVPDLPPAFAWISVDGQSDRFTSGGMFNGNAGHIAIFPVVLPVVRIATHYYAGATGLTQELASARIERLLAATGYTGRRMIEPAYAPYADQVCSADDVGNTQAGTSLSNIVTSTSPSVLYVAPTSDMTYHVKARTFNEPVRWILGEYSAIPLNQNYVFTATIEPWTGLGGASVAISGAYAYQGLQCMLVTPPAAPVLLSAGGYDGVPGITIPGSFIPGAPGPAGLAPIGATSGTDTTAIAGFTYTAAAQVMVPYGWTVEVNLGWQDDTGGNLGYVSSGPVIVAPGVWTQITVTAAAPPGTVNAEIQTVMLGVPSPAIGMFVDQAMITQGSQPGGEIPYQGSIAYDYDPTRVINAIQVTQLDRQDVVTPQVPALEQASATQYGTYTDYLTGYLYNDVTTPVQGTDPSNLLDLANWLAETNATPRLRVKTVTVDAASNPVAWPLVLGISPGDVIIVNRRPPTAANLTITLVLRVTQVARNIQFSASDSAATVTLTVDACPENMALKADDAIRGQLDALNLLGW